MKISLQLCRPLNFVAPGGCLFRLYDRAGPEGIRHFLKLKSS